MIGTTKKEPKICNTSPVMEVKGPPLTIFVVRIEDH